MMFKGWNNEIKEWAKNVEEEEALNSFVLCENTKKYEN